MNSTTYFVRHTRVLDIDDATRQLLWNERRIAIHYPNIDVHSTEAPDSRSLDLDEYTGSARRALKALKSLGESGGYVCAQYAGFNDVLVGQVLCGSQVELWEGRWGNRNGREGLPAVLKTLLLRDAKTIKPQDCAVILIGKPRQGTIMRWPRARQIIANLVENRRLPPSLADLSPDQQEIMCSEFLRAFHGPEASLPTLAHLIVPVGRTMKDIDICALAADGKRIMAQVTYHEQDTPEAQSKVQRLKRYGNDGQSHLIMFSCEGTSNGRPTGGVTFVPLERVFRHFQSSQLGTDWLQLAIFGSSGSTSLSADPQTLEME